MEQHKFKLTADIKIEPNKEFEGVMDDVALLTLLKTIIQSKYNVINGSIGIAIDE
jgi:hypothetical protein